MAGKELVISQLKDEVQILKTKQSNSATLKNSQLVQTDEVPIPISNVDSISAENPDSNDLSHLEQNVHNHDKQIQDLQRQILVLRQDIFTLTELLEQQSKVIADQNQKISDQNQKMSDQAESFGKALQDIHKCLEDFKSENIDVFIKHSKKNMSLIYPDEVKQIVKQVENVIATSNDFPKILNQLIMIINDTQKLNILDVVENQLQSVVEMTGQNEDKLVNDIRQMKNANTSRLIIYSTNDIKKVREQLRTVKNGKKELLRRIEIIRKVRNILHGNLLP